MSKHTYVLDPGHGGAGPNGEYLTRGKRSPHVPPGIYEGIFNRQICKQVAKILEEKGISVTITNPGAVNASAKSRTAYVRALHEEIGNCVFISVHANAARGQGWSKANGTVVFRHPANKKSDKFAHLMLGSFGEFTALPTKRGVKKARFSVLSGTKKMISILIECGFMTNENDAEYMASIGGQADIARAIAIPIIKIEAKGKRNENNSHF